jgi:hypothetical protein
MVTFIFTFVYTAEWISMFGISTFRNDPFSYYSFYISWPFPTNQFEFAQLANRFSQLPAIALVTPGPISLFHCMRLTVLFFYLNRLVFNNVTYFMLSKKSVSTKNKMLRVLLFSVHLMVLWLISLNIFKWNRHFTLELNFDVFDGFNDPNSSRTAI